jgi:transcriptional regulator GlxA family with amidase domain
LTEFVIEQTSLRVDCNVDLQASSLGLGWTDLFAAITCELPHDALHGAGSAVWLATAAAPHEIRRVGAGYRYERLLPRNAISICGAGDGAYDEVVAPVRAVHVYLRQQLINEVADEFFKDGRGRRQVRSLFGLGDPILQQLLTAIRLSLNDLRLGNRLKMDHLSQALAVYLLTKHSELGPVRGRQQMPMFNSREIGRTIDYIDANLSSNMSVAELAEVVGLGRAQFSARFRATTSMTPHQFVIIKRISKARQLIAEPNVDYSFVALRCGFASSSHLVSSFKRIIGLTPDEYRRQAGLTGK